MSDDDTKVRNPLDVARELEEAQVHQHPEDPTRLITVLELRDWHLQNAIVVTKRAHLRHAEHRRIVAESKQRALDKHRHRHPPKDPA